jgi:uncharacterized protein (TIGR04141 family)
MSRRAPRGQYLCLDTNQAVRDPLGARSSLEICDLLGPNNELIHVKRAEGSAPLSHLFSQGLISAQSLVAGPPAVLERFVKTVAALPHGLSLAVDFKPAKVVYAPAAEGQAANARYAISVLPGQPGSRRQDPRYVWHRRGGRRHPSRVDLPAVSG